MKTRATEQTEKLSTGKTFTSGKSAFVPYFFNSNKSRTLRGTIARQNEDKLKSYQTVITVE